MAGRKGEKLQAVERLDASLESDDDSVEGDTQGGATGEAQTPEATDEA